MKEPVAKKIVQCKWCAEDIDSSARICKHCKHFSSGWLRISNFGDLLTHIQKIIIIAGAVVFMFQFGGKFWVYLFPISEVRLVALNSQNDVLTLWNSGNTDVFVRSVVLCVDGRKRRFSTIPVNALIKPGETYASTGSEKLNGAGAMVIAGYTEEDRKNILEHRLPDNAIFSFYDVTDPEVLNITHYDEKVDSDNSTESFTTLDATATIHMFSVAEQELIESPPIGCRALIMLLPDENGEYKGTIENEFGRPGLLLRPWPDQLQRKRTKN